MAEHSFYVALAADRIASYFWEWGENKDWRLLHRHALTHDQVEAITGDVPAIAKKYVGDDLLIFHDFAHYVQEIPTIDSEIYDIVKAADLYETCRFLATELSMGNKSVLEIYKQCYAQLAYHMSNCGKPYGIMLRELDGLCGAAVLPMVAT